MFNVSFVKVKKFPIIFLGYIKNNSRNMELQGCWETANMLFLR